MSRQTFDDDALARALRALADADAREETPSRLEAAVMARWDASRVAAHASPVRPHVRTFVRGAATLAAGVTIVGAVALDRELAITPMALPPAPIASVPSLDVALRTPAPTLDAAEHAGPQRVSRAVHADDARSALVLVGAPIENGERVRVVRMRVAREALVALGVAATVTADMVDVDVLVGEDGVARGVRAPL
jgi:hypothetical protein